MKIVFLNTHSSLNPGDAGIVLAQAQFFMDHSLGIQMVLISRTPHIDKLFYKTFRAQVLPPLIPAPSVFKTNYQKIAGSLKNIFDLKSKAKLIKAIKDCDLVVCSGGGYFYSNRKILPGLMFFQNIMHVEVARLLQKSIVFFRNPSAPSTTRSPKNSSNIFFSEEKLQKFLLGKKSPIASSHNFQTANREESKLAQIWFSTSPTRDFQRRSILHSNFPGRSWL